MFKTNNDELVKIPETIEDVMQKNKTAEYIDMVAEKIKSFAMWAAVIVAALTLINVLLASFYVEYGEIKVNAMVLLLGLARSAVEAWLVYWAFYYIGSMLKGYAMLIQQNDYQAKALLYELKHKKEEEKKEESKSAETTETEKPKQIVTETRCPICGTVNSIDNKFCIRCGKKF